ncbi:cell division and transport-associated protein TolQ [Sinobacterium caligoides]|uniref:Tol-Pal system protein TolQ n=1 Tax=Sinobacterium caligoides TaxID=933926 RepID=A0A3N2DH67_9GAMM|nr:cell division and transport-associated protein TolQ [Sinobacterium caligoides]
MNEQMSIMSLVSNASLLVQMVMLALLLASMVSWSMIVRRSLFFRRAKREQMRFEGEFWSGMDLAQLFRDGNEDAQAGKTRDGCEAIFRAGFKEFTRLRQQKMDADAVMEGTQRAMRVALNREEERLDQNLPFLASVGSTSPYVGLFGTVWGIMSSFRGLANAHQATLQTVAPGISEALVATAMGLFAAIPAVLAYNRLSARSDSLYSQYETFSDEFSSILHRQVHARTTTSASQ